MNFFVSKKLKVKNDKIPSNANWPEVSLFITKGTGPTVVFLGGFKSDMEGSKAIFVEKWAKKRNRSFLSLIHI